MKKITFLLAFMLSSVLLFSQSILVVDRDGSSWTTDFADCWPQFQAALDANGYTYTYHEVLLAEDDGPDLSTMLAYDIVIWFTGEVWNNSSTLTENDETNLGDYLDAGNSLFLSGQDYLWDRYQTGFAAGDFPYDHLGLRTVTQDVWSIQSPAQASIAGEAGSLAAGMDFEVQDIFTSDREGLYIDEITDHIGDDMFELYDPTPAGICGTQYESGVYKIVFTTASFAAIVDAADRNDLMDEIIQFLEGTVNPNPNIVINPDFFDFTLQPGDSEQQTMTITNSGGADLTFDIAITYYIGDDWLTTDPISGTLPPSDNIPIDVTAYSTGLTLGTYTADIEISSNDPDDPTVVVPVTLLVNDPSILPPNNLMAEVLGNDVHLTWEEPGISPIWIHWDDGINNDGIGLTEGGTFLVAARFTPEDIAMYDGFSLTKVSIFPRGYNTGYTLKVWEGANASTLIVDQTLSGLTIEDWNEIDLDTPLAIDVTKELWIGYECTDQPVEDFPAGCDAGPAVAGFGDMISMDGVTWDPLSGFGLDYNWNIQGFLDMPVNPSTPIPLVKKQLHNTGSPVQGNLTASENAIFNPVSRDLQGYNVYRDNVMINTSLVTDLFYDDMDLDAGAYYYGVSAVYDEGESAQAGPVEAIVIGQILFPPNNLMGVAIGYDVLLTWEEPGLLPTWIHWDDGVNGNSIGLTEGGSFYAAARFTPNDLAMYNGMSLTKIAFFPLGYNTTYELNVWVGDNAATLMLTQPLSGLIIEEWNEIDLTYPITVDVTQELWIGYECINHPVGEHPAGTDAGPAIAGFGDLISTNGSTWDPISGFGLDYNWNIQGYLESLTTPDQVIIPLAKKSIANESESLSASNIRTGKSHKLRALQGYNVYRDEIMINPALVTDLFYDDYDLELGTYYYTVTAVYDEGESEPAGPVEIVIDEPSCDPPNNVNAENEPGSPDVLLTWELPGDPPVWIHWDDGISDDGIGLTEGGTFLVAARFGTEHLSDYDGMFLTTVAIFPRGYNTGYVLKVWTGANAGTLELSQPLSGLIMEEWNEIVLDMPIEVDASDELWFGYECTEQPPGDYPAGCDAGPAVAEYGDMISMDGSTWDPLSGFGMDFNWNIQGYLVTQADAIAQPGEIVETTIINNKSSQPVQGNLKPSDAFVPNASRDLIGYNVFRNDIQLNMDPVEELYYEDMGLPNDYYLYCVTAVYDECESEAVCDELYITVDIDELNADEISIYPNPSDDILYIEYPGYIKSFKVINHLGQIVFSDEKQGFDTKFMLNVSDYQSGIYFISIETNSKTILEKVAIQ